LWNPISFSQVYAPSDEIEFVTATGAFRTPWGWTIGAKGYYDVKNGRSPEYDIVGLYQNPCKCWSLGFYYLQFPDREQYFFMFSLTGIGWTENGPRKEHSQSAAHRGERSAMGDAWRAVWEATIGYAPA
jgi:LPS-assembly protein